MEPTHQNQGRGGDAGAGRRNGEDPERGEGHPGSGEANGIGLWIPPWLTKASVFAVALGLVGGIAAHETQNVWLLRVAGSVTPLGELWTNALLMLVLPLMMGTIFVALVDGTETRGGGRRTALTFGVFVSILVAAGLYAVVAGLPLARALVVQPETAEALRASVSGATAGLQATAPVRFSEWLPNLIPSNPIAAAANGDLLSLVVATLLFALAASRLSFDFKLPLVRLARGVTGTSFVLMGWVLLPMPIAAFCVVFPMATNAGMPLAGALGYYLLVLLALLAGFMFLLYPVASLAGVSLRRFARGLAPAQTVAIATRSSLASLPALLEGARTQIGLRRDVGDLALPLGAATFRVNTMISAPFQLFFLTHLFGLPLTPQFIALFLVAKLVLSFGTPGIPSGGQSLTLPLYLAAGIPVEGVVLANAIDAIPDILKTLVNVTANMTAAVAVGRVDGVPLVRPTGASALDAPTHGVGATAQAIPAGLRGSASMGVSSPADGEAPL